MGLTGVELLLLGALCESLPKSTQHGEELRTSNYKGLADLIWERARVKIPEASLKRAKKGLISKGLIRFDGEILEIVYEAFNKIGLYSQRQGRTQQPQIPGEDRELRQVTTPQVVRQQPKTFHASTAQPLDFSHLPGIESQTTAQPARGKAKRKQQADRLEREGSAKYAAWEAQREASLAADIPEVVEVTATPEPEESTAVRVMREEREKKEADPTYGMSWTERMQYLREQEKKAAIAEAAKPLMGGLFDHPEEDDDEAPVPLRALASNYDWSREQIDVDDGEM